MKQKNKDVQPQTEPYIVKSHDIHIDADYVDWIADIKHRYRSAQVKAAVKVNAEKLLFNRQLGCDLVQKKAEERWGAGVVEQVSMDLKREFPDADGFSTSNLWYMKKWYLFYTQGGEEILRQASAVLQMFEKQHVTKLHQVGGEFPLPFALVPWRHHVEIITKCKSIGLLVCSDMDKIDVQWSFKGINTPVDVATYDNIKIKDALPSQEQLAERVQLIQKELKKTKQLTSTLSHKDDC